MKNTRLQVSHCVMMNTLLHNSFLLWLSGAPQLSVDNPGDAGILCDEAAEFGAAVKGNRNSVILSYRHSFFTYTLQTYLLTPWCRVLLEQLTGLHLVKKFPAFHGTRRFVTALTSARHLSLSWASPIQSILPPDCFVSRASIRHVNVA